MKTSTDNTDTINAFVIYTGLGECLITTVKKEEKFLAIFEDRDFENDYDREVTTSPFVTLTSRITAW